MSKTRSDHRTDETPARSGTKDRETLSGTGWKHVAEVAMSQKGVDGCSTFPEPKADHGPKRTDTKDSETVSGTGLRGGNGEDEVHGSSRKQHNTGRLVDGFPTKIVTKDRETLSETGRKQVVAVAISKTGSTFAAPSRTTS
jgi:hypothetical protein